MKKISILSLHLGYGGIEKSIVALANILCNKYDVEIACVYNLYKKPVFDLDKRVKVKFLNTPEIVPNKNEFKESVISRNLYRIYKESCKAVKVLRLRKKTIIKYIKDTDSNIIISTRDIFNKWLGDNKKDGVITIGWEHNHFHNNMKYAKKVIDSCKKLDYFVLVSSNLRDYYSKYLTNTKCVFIPNCIEKIPDRQSDLSNKHLISVGRLSPEKGYLDLLKIYKKLIVSYPDWKLDIVGDGVDKKLLEDYAFTNNLNGVTFHGYQGKDYIEKLMLSSSIYLMTSHTESFGIVLIEAMSYGIPCLAYDTAEGARDIIINDYNGYLIKNRDIDLMVSKIGELIDNREERIRLGENGLESIKKYTSDVIANDWINLIEKSDTNE